MGNLKRCMDEQNRNFRQHIIEVIKGKICDMQMQIYEAKDLRDDLIDSRVDEAHVDRHIEESTVGRRFTFSASPLLEAGTEHKSKS